jgi:hypothetical protein
MLDGWQEQTISKTGNGYQENPEARPGKTAMTKKRSELTNKKNNAQPRGARLPYEAISCVRCWSIDKTRFHLSPTPTPNVNEFIAMLGGLLVFFDRALA